MELTVENASSFADAFLANCEPYPDGFEGRGIVICGGGIKYGACSYVLVRMLRHLGCRLPVEVWCLNDDEHDPQWIDLLRPFNAVCVNAHDLLPKHPHMRLGGWELKSYAIKHSRFREVLFLDADNLPIRDPSFLFETPEYRETGTIFWPDPPQFRTPAKSYLWALFGVNFREGPDQESGQLLIDKSRCWRAISLCNWYNEHSNFYYKHVYGDKETFRFAWQRLEQPISWAPFPSSRLLFTLVQHSIDDRELFQHRFYRKWRLYGNNTSIPGFIHEKLCLSFLDELRGRWGPQYHLMRHVGDADRERMQSLMERRFLYIRPGHNRWTICLDSSGQISEGFGPNEYFWWCENERLRLIGSDGLPRCELEPIGDGRWSGEATKPARTWVELRPLAA